MIFLQLPYFTKELDDCNSIFEQIIYVLKHMDILQRMSFLIGCSFLYIYTLLEVTANRYIVPLFCQDGVSSAKTRWDGRGESNLMVGESRSKVAFTRTLNK